MNFNNWTKIKDRFFVINSENTAQNQDYTNDVFTEKWTSYSKIDDGVQDKLFDFQKKWFLQLYGFNSEQDLALHLNSFDWILDAGCGLGFKAAWFASLAPNSKVIGIDFSSSAYIAHETYKDEFENLIFAQGDIAATKLPSESVGFVVCDQVIMHTEDPSATLRELSRITANNGEVCCYWYKKKALPRELLDDYYRKHTLNLSNGDLWQLSSEVLELGKMLSELKIEADFPNVPSLGIVGGKMDLQRFIYWNFIKCFWNEELGYETSLSTNFDWYSPANAKRFSIDDVNFDLDQANLMKIYFHDEEACYSGRFNKL